MEVISCSLQLGRRGQSIHVVRGWWQGVGRGTRYLFGLEDQGPERPQRGQLWSEVGVGHVNGKHFACWFINGRGEVRKEGRTRRQTLRRNYGGLEVNQTLLSSQSLILLRKGV